MVLSDRDIKAALVSGRIGLLPYSIEDVQPASIDVHLGSEFILLREAASYHCFGSLLIRQGDFVLAVLNEELSLGNDIMAHLEGISTMARKGIIIHTAGHVDPGWSGRLTLEISCFSPRPVMLSESMRIGQLIFQKLSSPAEKLYAGKYKNADSVQEAR